MVFHLTDQLIDMAYSDYLSGAQFPPANYRSAYKRAQEISANMPAVVPNGRYVTHQDRRSEKRQTMRALMHSDMPASHLSGLSAIFTGVEHGGVGVYDPPSKSIEMGFDFREQKGYRKESANAQHALVHEIGHHQTGKAQAFGGPGVKEGLAENYAEKYRGKRYSHEPSIYDEDVKDKIGHIGGVPRERVAYKKVRKSKELPRGHGEF